MSTTSTATGGTGPRGGRATRERILAAASELFYEHGIQATSADRILEKVGITKVTFYRHFRTKVDIVVAYLEHQAAGERGLFAQARQQDDPLQFLAEAIGDASCSSGFRGCPFINAAAEYADSTHPVRAVIDAHRAWMRAEFEDVATGLGVPDVRGVAAQLVMLRDGAMVNGYLADPATVAGPLGAGFRSVISASRRSGD
jgi:AcrR family transcriptional regulator